MSLFKQLYDEVLLEGYTIDMTVSALPNDRMIVLLRPKNKEGAKESSFDNLKPLKLEGTPEELDKEFISTIKTPMNTTFEAMSNAESYLEQLAKAQAETKKAKEKKDAKVKEEKQEEDQRTADQKSLDEANKLFNDKAYKDAEKLYKKLSESKDTSIANTAKEKLTACLMALHGTAVNEHKKNALALAKGFNFTDALKEKYKGIKLIPEYDMTEVDTQIKSLVGEATFNQMNEKFAG